MSINLIIATYAGKIKKYIFNNKKNEYLKYNLEVLNYLNFDITQITIMKPNINEGIEEIKDYYDFSKLDIPNIIEKIKIIECDNIGISYGQLFNALHNNKGFDYHIFIEDDYLFFNKKSVKNLLDEFNNLNKKDALLCSFIYKNRNWNLLKYAEQLKESEITLKKIKNKFKNININPDNQYIIPDFSLCIFSKDTINKIFVRFNFYQIYDLFSAPFNAIWIHQVLYGLILYESNVEIYDFQDNFINIFYNTSYNSINLSQNNQNIKTYEIQKKLLKKLNNPIFIPLDIFIFNKFINEMELISFISNNSNQFFEDYEKIKNIIKL